MKHFVCRNEEQYPLIVRYFSYGQDMPVGTKKVCLIPHLKGVSNVR
jgi:hypothetical protein